LSEISNAEVTAIFRLKELEFHWLMGVVLALVQRHARRAVRIGEITARQGSVRLPADPVQFFDTELGVGARQHDFRRFDQVPVPAAVKEGLTLSSAWNSSQQEQSEKQRRSVSST
jgi:hypothetical protein